MKREEEIIQLAREHMSGLELVHVDGPDAELGFLAGKVLFDVSIGGHKLQDFFSMRPNLDKVRAKAARGFLQSRQFGSGDETHVAYVAVHENYGTDQLKQLLRQLGQPD